MFIGDFHFRLVPLSLSINKSESAPGDCTRVHDPGAFPCPGNRNKCPNRNLIFYAHARTRDKERIFKIFILFKAVQKPRKIRLSGRFIGTFGTSYWDFWYELLGLLVRWITLLGLLVRWICG